MTNPWCCQPQYCQENAPEDWCSPQTCRACDMTNYERFQAELTKQYEALIDTPDYALAKARYTPAQLAEKITKGLRDNTANKDGEGVKRTCKVLGIKFTYGAIQDYLKGQ